MKVKIDYGETGKTVRGVFEFGFNDDSEISKSLECELEIHKISVLFTLSALHCLGKKNKGGIDLGIFCFIISKITNLLDREEFHVLTNKLARLGFISVEKYIDNDGDGSVLLSLINDKLGENLFREFRKKYPQLSDDIGKLEEFDIEKISTLSEGKPDNTVEH